MSGYKYTPSEQLKNNVLAYQEQQLQDFQHMDMTEVEKSISESEELLRKLGREDTLKNVRTGPTHTVPTKVLLVPSWESLCKEAENAVGSDCRLEALFSDNELAANRAAVRLLNDEYKVIYRLDAIDYSICAIAGIVAGAVDILLVGIPAAGTEGVEAGPLSDFIRKKFEEAFPPEEMEKLANSKSSKVPYDAQDNRNTKEHIEGLSAYYHRLLSLGHDPLLGFVVGVFDIMTGRMTTIDKSGKIVSQVMENYAERKETNIFSAIAKQLIHLKSDITTSMGLPAPLMGLFNLLQFGSIGEAEQTIAEIVQGMYYEGYDFIHFCSMSIPAMLVEVIVRLCYAIKRIKEGNPVKDSIPISLDRTKQPKLATMLFISHSAAIAINAGKVYFTQNPLAINYPQWMAFAKYSYKQLKWVMLEKPAACERYVSNKLDEQLSVVYGDINSSFAKISESYVLMFEAG